MYVAAVQYFVVQFVVASKWIGEHSWRTNLISDLGNTECALYAGRMVCSPANLLMNVSFVVQGVLMAVGSILVYRLFTGNRSKKIGFGLMVLAGAGTVLVGVFPENTVPVLHGLGAIFGLLIANCSLLVLAYALSEMPRWLRIYTVVSGVFSIVCFVLFMTKVYAGLGAGGMERLVSYPHTIWMIVFGLYMVYRVRGLSQAGTAASIAADDLHSR